MTAAVYNLRTAGPEDAAALMEVINEAFQIERKFFSEDRISLDGVREHLQKGTFIIAESDDHLAGCVYTELRENSTGYFGLLSVAPAHQGQRLGPRLITEAEDLCREAGCRIMRLYTIDVRPELPPYYEKFGYAITGTEQPDPDPSALQPYHYVVMEKTIGE